MWSLSMETNDFDSLRSHERLPVILSVILLWRGKLVRAQHQASKEATKQAGPKENTNSNIEQVSEQVSV